MKKKVVIIDDEMDLCHLLHSYLSDMNFEVHMAHSLGDGDLLLDSVTPDILFVDNNLPDGLGWEKLSIFESRFPQCKINLISAYDAAPVESKSGRVRIIEKPLRLHLLKDYL
jgi:two-component system, OmpR family, response regulator